MASASSVQHTPLSTKGADSSDLDIDAHIAAPADIRPKDVYRPGHVSGSQYFKQRDTCEGRETRKVPLRKTA